MSLTPIKNIVFDIGNVLLRWSPRDIIKKVFPEEKSMENLYHGIFKSAVWYDLNLGKITELEAIHQYNHQLAIPLSRLKILMHEIKNSLIPLEGSLELLDELYQVGVPLYSITDNIREIMSFLKKKYAFFDKFQGIVVSADIHILKPAEDIYRHLLKTYNLIANESIFIDDLQKNVEGAEKTGMIGLQFTNAAACRATLKTLGVRLPDR